MAKQEFITKQYLDKTLKEHSKVIIDAVSAGFEAVNDRFEAINDRFETVNDKFEAINDRFEENKSDHIRFEKKIDETWNLFDRYIKNQEDFRQEFVIMKAEIDSTKEIIKKKLGVEARIK